MKKTAFRNRMTVLKERMSDLPSDTLWIVQPENRRYLSGFRAFDTQINESSGSLLIKEDSSLLVTDSRYTVEAQKESVDFEVFTMKKGLVESFPEILSGLGTQKMAFEEYHVTWGMHRQLSGKFRKLKPPIRLTPMKGLVDNMRLIKDRAEIKAMEASSDLMSDILGEIIPRMEPGVTEEAVAWQIENLAREGGAEDLAFPSIVASGPNGALPHAVPGARKIRAREPIVIDVGVKVDGYCCDMTRTVFLDTPGPKFKKIYSTVRRAQLAALEKIRPGVKSTVPDTTARDMIKDAGFGDYFGHALGHGVGLATHEGPRLGPEKPVTLEEGMVVTVEPGIYLPRKGGVRLEELVVIEKEGPRILTKDRHFYDF
ncbi:M24 family metallopeptidase [Thermodesulfobacteriota bacterium]